MSTVTITEDPLALEELLAIVEGARVELTDGVRTGIAASRAVVTQHWLATTLYTASQRKWATVRTPAQGGGDPARADVPRHVAQRWSRGAAASLGRSARHWLFG
jgi:hypothetical protein